MPATLRTGLHAARLCLCLLVLAFGSAGVGRAESAGLPEIVRHSDTDVTIYQGDLLTLEVQANGKDIEAKWMKSNAMFCRALACEIDTSNWSLGRHSVNFVVFNDAGSMFLRFNIMVLRSPSSHRPAKVRPQLVESTAGLESVNADDLSVKALSGRGFSYHQHKVQIVGPQPRALDWTERLRTQRRGILEFGRTGSEDHVLAGRSAAKLLKTDGDRRVILLKRGALRSRNLSSKNPRWSVLVGDWLQVDTDAKGDVLVSTVTDAKDDDDDEPEEDEADAEKAEKKHVIKTDSVTITVLRGNARVYLHRTGAGKGDDAGTAVVVEQGFSVTTHPEDDTLDPPEIASARGMRSLVANTSPQYMPEQLSSGFLEGGAYLGVKKAKSFAAALEAAQDFNAERDYFRAIEAMVPYWGDIKQTYAADMVLAEAYSEILQSELALTYLSAAADLEPNAAAPYFMMGRIQLLNRKWHAALESFNSAEARDYPDQQLLRYYQGVAAYNSHRASEANEAFTYVVWDESGNPAVLAAAREFLGHVQSVSWYDLRLRAGLFYDSNILHSNSLKLSSLNQGLTTNRGAGYEGAAGLSLWPKRTENVKIEMAYDGGKDAYLVHSLSKLAVIQDQFAVNSEFLFGGVPEQKWVGFGLDLFLHSEAIGGQRALDELGAVFVVGSQILYNLRFAYEVTNAVDPLPGRNIIVDPIRWEVVPSGDRSAELKYTDVSLLPLAGPTFQLGLGVRTGKVAYKSSYVDDEDFSDVGGRVQAVYVLSLRSKLLAGLTENARSFTRSDDGRKDKTYAVNAGWKWNFTTNVFQDLGLVYESQKSTRTVNTYKREFLSYSLNLAL